MAMAVAEVCAFTAIANSIAYAIANRSRRGAGQKRWRLAMPERSGLDLNAPAGNNNNERIRFSDGDLCGDAFSTRRGAEDHLFQLRPKETMRPVR